MPVYGVASSRLLEVEKDEKAAKGKVRIRATPYVIVAGGGGAAKTGVPNVVSVNEMVPDASAVSQKYSRRTVRRLFAISGLA